MSYRDPEQQRTYQREYKRLQRAIYCGRGGPGTDLPSGWLLLAGGAR